MFSFIAVAILATALYKYPDQCSQFSKACNYIRNDTFSITVRGIEETFRSKLSIVVYDSLVPGVGAYLFSDEIALRQYGNKDDLSIKKEVFLSEMKRAALDVQTYSVCLESCPDEPNPTVVLYFYRLNDSTLVADMVPIVSENNNGNYGYRRMMSFNRYMAYFFAFDEHGAIQYVRSVFVQS